jgi:hypothetical protein
MQKLIHNGPSKYPGANFVVKADGAKLSLQFANREDVARDLKIGDVVERHL